MRKFIVIPAAIIALGLTGCAKSPQEACEDHGGVKAVIYQGEMVPESRWANAPENSEATCQDNTEFESDGDTWSED